MGMATAQGTAALNAQYAVQLSLAEEALPMVRNVLQGALYVCFPLVLLLAFCLDAGRMLGLLASYVLTLVWVELWPPLYAVLNHYGTLRSMSVLNAAAWTQSAGGAGGAELTLATARGLYETGISEMAVVGYLVLAIPVFASALVFGLSKLGSIGVGALVGAGAHRVADTALGNVSSGTVNMDKADLAQTITDPAMLRTTTAFGTRVGQVPGAGAMIGQVEPGRASESIAFEQQQSRLSSSFTVSSEQVEQYSRQADHATNLSRSLQQGAGRAQSAALVNALSLANEAVRSGSVQGEAGQATLGGTRNAFSQLQELADGVNRTLGKENGARVMNQALAGGGLNLNVLRAGIEGSNSSHEAMAAANQLVDRFQRSTQGVQATELMRQWRESSSYQWARSHNQRGLESVESNWREAEELHQRAEHTLQHAEVYRRAAENAQRLVQQGRTDLTTGIAQFAYATGRGAMVETLDPIAQRRNLNALRLEYLGRGGFLADGAFVPSIDALGTGMGRSAREQLGASEARLGTEASATASFDGVRSETMADPFAQRSRTERSVRAAQAGAGVDPRRGAGGGDGASATRELRAIEQRLEAGQRDAGDRAAQLQSGVRQSTDHVHEALRDSEVRGAAGQTGERPSVLRQLLAPLQRWSRGGWFGDGK
jgi:conjugal transfer mating pair stabilization protein TraG